MYAPFTDSGVWHTTMKKSAVILVTVLLIFFGIACRRRPAMDAKQVQGKVEELVKAEWEKIAKPLPPGADNPGSPSWIGWSYQISPPFPAAWPPDGKGGLYYYAYATGFQPGGLADGERLGPVWARIKVDVTGQSAPRLEILAKEIKVVGTVGVRPLTQEEIAVYGTGDALAAQVYEASRKTDAKALDAASARKYYCDWAKDSGVGEDIRRFHSEFFKWLGC
jgi:hypothetical protein